MVTDVEEAHELLERAFASSSWWAAGDRHGVAGAALGRVQRGPGTRSWRTRTRRPSASAARDAPERRLTSRPTRWSSGVAARASIPARKNVVVREMSNSSATGAPDQENDSFGAAGSALHGISMVRFRILPLIWVIVGSFVASQHHYFAHLDTGREIVNMLLAVIFWPLVLHHPIVIRSAVGAASCAGRGVHLPAMAGERISLPGPGAPAASAARRPGACASRGAPPASDGHGRGAGSSRRHWCPRPSTRTST